MTTTKKAERTMTLGDFLSTYACCRVWWTSAGSPTGEELALNTDTEIDEDYCDAETLLDFIPRNTGHLDGTVTRDGGGEWRWEVDSLQDEHATDFNRNTLFNLVVWGLEE